jgi:hypothetical protein
VFSCTSDNTTTSANHVGCLCQGPQIRSLTRRIDADLSRRGFAAGLAASIASLGLPKLANAQPAQAPGGSARPILFTRFRLFDGTSSKLRDGLSLLVEGNRITALAAGNPAAPDGAHVIDCGGRTVMPGLIDAHWHSIFAALPLTALMSADVGYIYLAASAEAERTLMRGFTTVRDLGGPSFALKQAIDDGLVPGPRIYPSGAMITATRRSRRPASIVRCAECNGHAQPRAAIRRQHHRRWSGCGAAAGARTTHAGCVAGSSL